jgi:hypothetical protein
MVYSTPEDYMYNLEVASSSEAKRIWKKNIKEEWNYKCAYCNSEENLTLDHIIPQSKGGLDVTQNVVCCCHSCNHSKGHTPWQKWYEEQEFFTQERKNDIIQWMNTNNKTEYVVYRPNINNIKF